MVRQRRSLPKLWGHGLCIYANDSKKKGAFSNSVATKRSVSSGSALFATLSKFLVKQCSEQF